MGDVKRTTRRFATREKWRQWLEKNHAKSSEVWLMFAKRGSGKKTVTYVDAVEEAICFGWIDTTVQRLDDDYFIQRFTPRSNNLNWSKINLGRFDRMEKEGLMTGAGRPKRPAKLPPPRKRLGKDPVAEKNFNAFAPVYRRNYLRWITEAKKQETRERRLEKAMQWFRENRKQ